MKRGRYVLTAMGILLCAAFLLGAGSEALAASKVVFATTGAGTGGFITTVMKRNKFDAKNGIDLVPKAFHPSKMQNALVFKQVEAGLFNPIAMARANLKGNDMRIFAPAFYNHISLMVPKGSAIKSLADLKGKKFGTMARITGGYNTFSLVNRLRGIDIEKDYKLIFGAPPVIIGLLKKAEIDMGIVFEPITSRVLTEGKLVEVTTISDLWKQSTGQPMVMIAVSAHTEWLNAHRSEAKRLTQAILDTLRYIKTQPGKAIRNNRQKLGAKTEAALALLLKRMPKIFPTEWNEPIIKNLQLQVEKAVEFGLLKKMPGGELFVNYLK